MSLTPSNVPWDSNRLKATEYIIKYDSSGNGYLDKQETDYTKVNYNFASLPAAGTTKDTKDTDDTDDTTDQTTTQQQTTQAFGEGVTPHYWDDKEDKSITGSSKRTFLDAAKDKYARTFTPESYYKYKGDFDQADIDQYGDEGTIYPDDTIKSKNLLQKGWEKIQKGIESSKRKFQIPMGFAGAIFKAVTKRPTISGSSADNSFRGVAGLYNKEIYLMNKYGSTGPTVHNPTGDTRKDDAGFNIVSGAGDYNVIGSWSRRHNMLKEVDKKYEKNSPEWKAERVKTRAIWKEEKVTGQVSPEFDHIDETGSLPSEGYGGHGSAEAASQAAESGGRDYSESPGAMAGDMEYGEE